VHALKRLGYPRLHLRSTSSTNEMARRLAISGAPAGTLVTASEQTAGRGRQGRGWFAPPESALLLSLVLRFSVGRDDRRDLLPLIAAVAVCDLAGPRARVKWPNDIVFEHEHGLSKLAGILAEGRPQEGWIVLGIGLNVAVKLADLPAEVRPRAATLGLEKTQIEPTLKALLTRLERRLSEPPESVLDAWRALDALCGLEIECNQGRGLAAGIDDRGRLLVKLLAGEQIALDAGEVHLQSGGYSSA